MLTVDQLVGTVVALLNDRNRIVTFIEKLAHTSDFLGKSDWSLHKRRSLRNCVKGMEFLTRDGCENELK